MATPSLTAFLARETRSFLRVRMVDDFAGSKPFLINAAPGLGQGCEISFRFPPAEKPENPAIAATRYLS